MAGEALVRVPGKARRGEEIEIRTLLRHPSESGYRRGADALLVPRNAVRAFICRYAGAVVFEADLTPGIAANPYIAFFVVATASGEFEFEWRDEAGRAFTARAAIAVVDG